MAQSRNKKASYKVLGIMSGTSLDGLDLCLVDFPLEQPADFKILASETISYSPEWQAALSFKALDARALAQLDEDYARFLAQQVNHFLLEHRIPKASVDCIGSHGHTWFHEPSKGISLQIGNRPILAAATGLKVVCDFRVQDIALGGQGAPLVPIGDRDLFGQHEACLNLGGFANISLTVDGKRLAWDIGPCNLPMNYYCKKLGLDYDADGTIGAAFGVNQTLFEALNALPFYQQSGPKSLGREWLDAEVFPLIDSFALSPEEKIATLNRHIAWQISECLKKHHLQKVLISGGGSYNTTLIQAIGSMGRFELDIAPAPLNDFKEALIFAYLAFLKLQGKNNVLASVTGAREDHCSGVVFEGSSS